MYFPLPPKTRHKYVATPCQGCGQVNYVYKAHDLPASRVATCMTCGTEQRLTKRPKGKEKS